MKSTYRQQQEPRKRLSIPPEPSKWSMGGWIGWLQQRSFFYLMMWLYHYVVASRQNHLKKVPEFGIFGDIKGL